MHTSNGLLTGKQLTLTETEVEALIKRAAKKGAQEALSDIGLDGQDAREDIRDLRSLLQALKFVRRTALQTTIRIITAALLAALIAGITIKMKIFGS